MAVEGGSGYCYVGPHPVDTRVVPGPAFDDTQGQHIRPYAPIDLRLFSYRNGCYYFVGDPRDFGYGGQSLQLLRRASDPGCLRRRVVLHDGGTLPPVGPVVAVLFRRGALVLLVRTV